MHIYEYLFAALVLVAILVAASVIATTMPNAQLSASDKEQVKVVAQKIITQITMEAGQPPNWGRDWNISQSDLQGFGLAKYGETTREAYVLDPDNVMRIDQQNIPSYLYIQPSTAANLLNLNVTVPEMSLTGSYGFTLTINPILRVNVSNPLGNTNIYTVNVTSEYEVLPLVNANISAKLYYLNGASIVARNAPSSQTDIGGNCVLTFNNVPDSPRVLAVSVYYLGIHASQVSAFGLNRTQGHVLGDTLLLNNTLNNIDISNVTEVIATRQNEQYVIKDFSVKASSGQSKNGSQYYTLSSIEPSVITVLAHSINNDTLIYASKNINITYSTIPQLASSTSSSLLSYSLERTVIIGDTTCSLRLLLWRMTY